MIKKKVAHFFIIDLIFIADYAPSIFSWNSNKRPETEEEKAAFAKMMEEKKKEINEVRIVIT